MERSRNVAIEHPTEMELSFGKSSVNEGLIAGKIMNGGFCVATFNYQRVNRVAKGQTGGMEETIRMSAWISIID